MKDFKKQWMESLPLVLPIRVDKFDYTIEQIDINCPECQSKLTNLRGRVYESIECVETDIVGLCLECQLVVGHRSRFYPATGRYLMYGNNGWKEGFMVSSWLNEVISFIRSIHGKIKKLKKFFKK